MNTAQETEAHFLSASSLQLICSCTVLSMPLDTEPAKAGKPSYKLAIILSTAQTSSPQDMMVIPPFFYL